MSATRRIRSRRFWTTHEVALLERLYPNLATVDVAARLDRPLSAVHGKAKALGVKKNQVFLASPLSGRFDGVRGQAARFQKRNQDQNQTLANDDAKPPAPSLPALCKGNCQTWLGNRSTGMISCADCGRAKSGGE